MTHKVDHVQTPVYWNPNNNDQNRIPELNIRLRVLLPLTFKRNNDKWLEENAHLRGRNINQIFHTPMDVDTNTN